MIDIHFTLTELIKIDSYIGKKKYIFFDYERKRALNSPLTYSIIVDASEEALLALKNSNVNLGADSVWELAHDVSYFFEKEIVAREVRELDNLRETGSFQPTAPATLIIVYIIIATDEKTKGLFEKDWESNFRRKFKGIFRYGGLSRKSVKIESFEVENPSLERLLGNKGKTMYCEEIVEICNETEDDPDGIYKNMELKGTDMEIGVRKLESSHIEEVFFSART